jgi:hypothetical protein
MQASYRRCGGPEPGRHRFNRPPGGRGVSPLAGAVSLGDRIVFVRSRFVMLAGGKRPFAYQFVDARLL